MLPDTSHLGDPIGLRQLMAAGVGAAGTALLIALRYRLGGTGRGTLWAVQPQEPTVVGGPAGAGEPLRPSSQGPARRARDPSDARSAIEPTLCRIVDASGEDGDLFVGGVVLVHYDGGPIGYALTCWHNFDPSLNRDNQIKEKERAVLDRVFLVHRDATGSLKTELQQGYRAPAIVLREYSNPSDDFAVLEVPREAIARLGLQPCQVTLDLHPSADIWVVGFDRPDVAARPVPYACQLGTGEIRPQNVPDVPYATEHVLDFRFKDFPFRRGSSGGAVFYLVAGATGGLPTPVLLGLAKGIEQPPEETTDVDRCRGLAVPIETVATYWPALRMRAIPVPSVAVLLAAPTSGTAEAVGVESGPAVPARPPDQPPAPVVPGHLPLVHERWSPRRWLLPIVAVLATLGVTYLGLVWRTEPVLPAVLDVPAHYVASGWMGDGAGDAGQTHVTWDPGWRTHCHSAPCVRVTYTRGEAGHAGIYFQHPEGNWGRVPGRRLASRLPWRAGYRRVVFWARADDTSAVEFKAGGIADPAMPYRDSFGASLGQVQLTPRWQEFTIDLTGQDLSNVVGAFAWVATLPPGAPPLTFYLDDITYQK